MKYVRFEKDEDPHYGEVIGVLNHKRIPLGMIRKHKWKRKEELVFEPEYDTFYSIDCLKQIVKKMDESSYNPCNTDSGDKK